MSENLSSINMTKILATLGPATSTPETIKSMIDSGVDCFRFNFSHGNHEERIEQIAWIRDAAEKSDREIAVLQDLQGPKIRLGEFQGEFDLAVGSSVKLIYGEVEPSTSQLPVQYDLSLRVKVGEIIYISDGKLKTAVTAVDPQTITVEVINGGSVSQKKGLNLPDTDFSGAIITEKDRSDIEFGLTQDYDYVALSFVQKADDIIDLRKMLTDGGSDAKIIAKIETK